MELSKFLSKVIGIYLIIISMAMFINMHQFTIYAHHLLNDVHLIFVIGLYIIIFGILMVVSHNIWQWNWQVLVTIFAWLIFFKGISLIFYPDLINKMAALFIHSTCCAYIAAGGDFLLGVLFSYFGYKRY